MFLTYSGKGGEGLAADESAAQGNNFCLTCIKTGDKIIIKNFSSKTADDSSEAQKTSAMEEETAEGKMTFTVYYKFWWRFVKLNLTKYF